MGVLRALGPADELAFFRQLWQHSSDPFWLCEVVGDDFIVVAVNPAEARLDSRIQPGLSLNSVFGHGEDAEALLSGYVTCRDMGEPLTFDQRPVINGNRMAFQTLLVPVKNDQGVVTHIWGSAADLTHFLQAQMALEALTSELEERVRERTAALNHANAELIAANERLASLALHDGLTGLSNRFHFFEVANTEIGRAIRYKRPLSLLMIDVDFFKRINDQYGHAAGDDVLRSLADIMSGMLRQNDVAARVGGEEFSVLLPETNLNDATAFAQRMRFTVAEKTLEGHSVTVSIGVAQLQADQSSVSEVLMRADAAMYRAKALGRNRVEVDHGLED